MLYASVMVFSLIASCYLLFRRANAIAPNVTSSVRLRRFTAAFLGTITLSYLLYMPLIYLTSIEKIKMLYFVGALFDFLTCFPLVIAILFTMLQDHRRPLWPIGVMMSPLVVGMMVCAITRSDAIMPVLYAYFLLLGIGLIIYMVRATRQYGRWLRDNYADLEHKEVWQSLLGLLCLILAFATYIVNLGSQFMEYLVQVETLFIVGFLTWRVDTIQQLSVGDEEFGPVRSAAGSQGQAAGGEDDAFIHSRLQDYCETTKLYLQHDLSLAQLSQAVGVDRADLSRYFARQGFTYNAYINRLRIDHFALLYREAVACQRPVTAQQLAFQCGFSSYSTFGVAFKQFMGQTATSWMNNVQ